MSKRSILENISHVSTCALFLTASLALGQQPLTYRTSGDVALCLAAAGGAPSEGRLLAGYTSGRLVRLSFAAGAPQVAWEAKADGGILAILEPSQPKQAGRDLLVSTTTGQVVCFRDDAPKPAWRFEATCEVSCLCEFPDVNNDGVSEVLAGGADHRVHLLNGKTGHAIWQRRLDSDDNGGYVNRLLVAPDQDHDGTPEVLVYLWSGEVAVVSGHRGKLLWQKAVGGLYTGALAAAQDIDGDGYGDFLIGGNDGIPRVCSGRDGTIVWSGRVNGPIRDVAVVPSTTAKNVTVYVCTARGEVARFDARKQDVATTPRWSADLGGVCRGVVATIDVDYDGTPDVAACAENGVTAILSGSSGRVLCRWQAGDTVRAICPLSVGDRRYLAVASLDATVRLLPVAPGDSAMSETEAMATQSAPAAQKPSHAQSQQPGGIMPPMQPEGASNSPRIIVLLYHDVLPEAVYHYATSVANFRAQMDALLEEKYVCVSLDQIAAWVEGKGGMPDRAVCITFDGQYDGQYTYAYPILRERKMFATSYITTDWIGTPNHADWHQIREMDAAGVLDVQNHTISHPYLTRCDRSEVIRQLTICNEAIARHMNGKLARHHTYPSGVNNDAVRTIVRELGFLTATTIRPGPVTRQHDLMGVPRYMLCTHKSLEEFRSWLRGVNTTAIDRLQRGTR